MAFDQKSFFSGSDDLVYKLESAFLSNAAHPKKNQIMEKKIDWLTEQVAEMNCYHFGKKSERYESLEQMVFNEVEIESRKPDPSSDEGEENDEVVTTQQVEVKAHTKTIPARGHRKSLPENLTRETVNVELLVEKQVDADGNA